MTAYINPEWKWVFYEEDTLPLDELLRYAKYGLRGIKSFVIYSVPYLMKGRWTICCSSNCKIYKWMLSYFNESQLKYKTLSMTDEEVKMFLDQLDSAMEVIYGR
jgi:hypothetical protein